MKTFTERRQAINAMQRFRPGMEEEQKEIPADFLILVFLAVVGFSHLIVYLGLFIIWTTV